MVIYISVYCGLGTYFDAASESCKTCEKGSYQDTEDGATMCTSCPAGETTQCRGATSPKDCFGKLSYTISESCNTCEKGSNQDQEDGATVCTACPTGETTQCRGPSVLPTASVSCLSSFIFDN